MADAIVSSFYKRTALVEHDAVCKYRKGGYPGNNEPFEYGRVHKIPGDADLDAGRT